MKGEPHIMRIQAGRRFLRSTLATLTAIFLSGMLFAPTAAAGSTRELQWYLDAMQAEEMWKSSQGEGVTVAVLDTGVEARVPELRGRVLKGKNFLDPKTSAHVDKHGHGTTMAALIAGSGQGDGIQGLSPEAKILPVTVIPDPEKDSLFGHQEKIAPAIDYAINNGADIISMSFGYQDATIFSSQVQDAIDRAHRHDILMFASSGNHAKEGNRISYPAAFPGVVGVAAGDKNGRAVDTSVSGSHIAISAPGDTMATKCDDNKRTCKNGGGTSAAAALTAASAALISSKHPNWTANQVLRVMLKTAGRASDSEGPSKYIGYGAVRPRIALDDGNIDPGVPEHSPLFSKYYTEKEKADPSPSSSRTERKSPAGAETGPEGTAAAENAGVESAQNQDALKKIIAIGGGGLVLFGAAGAFVLSRRRQASR